MDITLCARRWNRKQRDFSLNGPPLKSDTSCGGWPLNSIHNTCMLRRVLFRRTNYLISTASIPGFTCGSPNAADMLLFAMLSSETKF